MSKLVFDQTDVWFVCSGGSLEDPLKVKQLIFLHITQNERRI